MIIKLQPSQISTMWDVIKFTVLEANQISPDQNDAFMNNILEKLLSGKGQAWLSFEDVEGERKFYAVGITCIMEDPLTNRFYLLLHSLYAYETMNKDIMHEAISKVSDFARANNCYQILAMTLNARIQKLFKFAGLDTEIFVQSKLV